MRALLVALVLSAVVWSGCSPKKEKIPAVPEMIFPRQKIVIYQLMTRLFGNTTSVNKLNGTLEENGVGKFNDINNRALEGIKELGVTHIWYTGVIEHATVTDYSTYGIALDDPDVVKGRAGSPYAIKDYYDVDPDLAVNVKDRMAEFEQLVDRSHKSGLKVIIDFIPNHVARSYHSDAKPENVTDLGQMDDQTKAFTPDNNFYYLPGQSFKPPQEHYQQFKTFFPSMDGKFSEVPAKATGDGQFTATPSSGSWFETVKLNYGIDLVNGGKTYYDSIPDTWNKMRDILVYWASKKVDGFRCDMAQMVPVEFWHWVIPQVKAVNHDLLFIAEIYEPHRYRDFIDRGRFDFLYDKVQLYDTLRLLINGRASAQDIPRIQQSLSGINGNMVHFLENHDEHRIASPFFAGDPTKALSAFVISATIDQGPIMIYFGQEVGEPASQAAGFGANDGTTTRYDYWGVPEHQKWMNHGSFDGGGLSDSQKALRAKYSQILNLAKESKAIAMGTYHDLTAFNVAQKTCSDLIVSYVRATDEEHLIIVAGFNPRSETVQIQLTEELAEAWGITGERKYEVEDLLGVAPQQLLGTEGLSFELPAYSACVFRLK
jgi:glycosidase